MATVISAYPPQMYHQGSYHYPTLSSVYSLQQPFFSNYFIPKQSPPQAQPQQQVQPQPQPPVTRQYVDSEIQSLRPRRQPRVYREVIVLPTPEPIYRQVRHRLPTPERQVVQRTVYQKRNGEVLVREQRSKPKQRTQSRTELNTQPRASRSRQVHTD